MVKSILLGAVRFSLAMLAAFAGFKVQGEPIQFQSAERQTVLLELYTSEGCSSCPPAESWLSGLKSKPGLWSDFVPVAFHIDYWDYLGWRDKWSNREFSSRQQDYASAWKSANVYTPEFVLNGSEWRNPFQLRGAPAASDTKAGVLKITSEDTNRWQVNFAPVAPSTNGYEVNAALLASGLGSDVKAGENSGRHLAHDFVVLKWSQSPLVKMNDGFRGAFTIPASTNLAGARLAVAVWVTRGDGVETVQSVGGWLGEANAK